MHQAVSRQPLTAEAQIRTQASLWGIYIGQSGSGKRVTPNVWGCNLSVSFRRSFTFIRQSPTLCNLSNWQLL